MAKTLLEIVLTIFVSVLLVFFVATISFFRGNTFEETVAIFVLVYVACKIAGEIVKMIPFKNKGSQ